VFVLCPPNLHSQIAVKALGIGKHVLCDRPAGLSQCESLKMVLAAQYYPSLICVLSHGLRFHPAFIHLKKNLEKVVGTPELCQFRIEMGPILGNTFNWLCDDIMGGGNVTLFGSHLIDLVTYFTGLRATRVHGVTKTLTASTASINKTRRITSPDFAIIDMEMETGMLVSITLLNQMQKGYFNQELLICGPKGYVKAHNTTVKGFIRGSEGSETGDQEILIYEDNEDNAKASLPLLPSIYAEGLLKLVGELRKVFSDENSTGRRWKQESTIGQLGAGFEEGLYIQAVIEAIRRSSKERSWVKVNVITEEPDPNPVLTAAVRTSTISM